LPPVLGALQSFDLKMLAEAYSASHR